MHFAYASRPRKMAVMSLTVRGRPHAAPAPSPALALPAPALPASALPAPALPAPSAPAPAPRALALTAPASQPLAPSSHPLAPGDPAHRGGRAAGIALMTG